MEGFEEIIEYCKDKDIYLNETYEDYYELLIVTDSLEHIEYLKQFEWTYIEAECEGLLNNLEATFKYNNKHE